MSISIEEVQTRVQQLKTEAENSANIHNVLLGRLAEAQNLLKFLEAHAAEKAAAEAEAKKVPAKRVRNKGVQPQGRAKPTSPRAKAATKTKSRTVKAVPTPTEAVA